MANKLVDKIVWISVALVVFFGWADAFQIQAVYQLKDPLKWELFNQFVAPSILTTWTVMLLVIAVVYYMFTKDKSESIALFAVPKILMIFGVQDIMFFIFSKSQMTACMDWFNYFPHTWINQLLGQTCTSPLGLIFSGVIGVFAALTIYSLFKKL